MHFYDTWECNSAWMNETNSYKFYGILPSRHTTSFQRLYDVYTTSLTSYRRRIDVETTSCVYWVTACSRGTVE